MLTLTLTLMLVAIPFRKTATTCSKQVAEAFQPPTNLFNYYHRTYHPTSFITLQSTSLSDVLGSSSFLSHVMLKVPSVDASAQYWTNDIGGTIPMSRTSENKTSSGRLLSAFVELGCSPRKENSSSRTTDIPPQQCFALEQVQTNQEKYSIGNIISYVGVSMLLQCESNLLGVITGNDKPKQQANEPNGLSVLSSASAPGDYFARFALKSNDLEGTCMFYTNVLGMDCKAQDEKMICLRYDNEYFSSGVPTTLVFDVSTEELHPGNCFDHIAITTNNCNITEISETLDRMDCKIFMKPTEMFGRQVMGVIDPNGYKIVLAGLQKN
jgi:hypothetical protein